MHGLLDEISVAELRAYCVLCEELHFTRAAKRLNTTQPPLSRSIIRMEQALGVQLLRRSTRRVVLTEAGELFRAGAQSALIAFEEAARSAKAVNTKLRLSVGMTEPALHGVGAATIKAFRRARPDLEIELIEMGTVEQEAALGSGVLDCGFLHPPVVSENLVLQSLENRPLVLAVPENHCLARRASLQLRELDGETLVLWQRERGPFLFDAIATTFSDAGVRVRLVGKADYQSFLGLAAAGLHASIVSADLIGHAKDSVSFVQLQPELPPMPYALAWPRGALSDSIEELRRMAVTLGVQDRRMRASSIAEPR